MPFGHRSALRLRLDILVLGAHLLTLGAPPRGHDPSSRSSFRCRRAPRSPPRSAPLCSPPAAVDEAAVLDHLKALSHGANRMTGIRDFLVAECGRPSVAADPPRRVRARRHCRAHQDRRFCSGSGGSTPTYETPGAARTEPAPGRGARRRTATPSKSNSTPTWGRRIDSFGADTSRMASLEGEVRRFMAGVQNRRAPPSRGLCHRRRRARLGGVHMHGTPETKTRLGGPSRSASSRWADTDRHPRQRVLPRRRFGRRFWA